MRLSASDLWARFRESVDLSSGLALLVSLLSLAVASASLKFSFDADRRNSLEFITSMTSVLVADYTAQDDSLVFATSEDAKLLSYGFLFLPDALSQTPLHFRAPTNAIAFAPLRTKAAELLRLEFSALYNKNPTFYPKDAQAIDYAIPVYAETKSTVGGSSIDSRSAYTLLMNCAVDEAFAAGTADADRDQQRCIFKAFIHEGRVDIGTPGFFHWPWSSAQKIKDKGTALRLERTRTWLNRQWAGMKKSRDRLIG